MKAAELERLMGFFTPPRRFSAIRCAAAVPRTPPKAPAAPQSAQGQRDPGAASTINGHGPPAAKGPPQQHRGIMGMFAAKAAARAQDTPKEAKAEAKEAPAVSDLRPLGVNDPLTVTSASPALLPMVHGECSVILCQCSPVCTHPGHNPLVPHRTSPHGAARAGALAFPSGNAGSP